MKTTALPCTVLTLCLALASGPAAAVAGPKATPTKPAAGTRAALPPRPAAEDLHALFLFTNVDRKPDLQQKFGVCIESLFRHLELPEPARLTLHFVADPGSKAYGEKLLRAYQRPGVRFVFHDKDELTARIFPIVEDMQRHFSAGKGSYYNDSIFFLSLGLHRILPPEIERIVKLDFDTRFETNLYLLFREFDRFAETNLIGVGPELQPVYRHVLRQYREKHPGTKLGEPLPDGAPGFNSGVLLLDLRKLRRSEAYNRALEPQAVAALAEKYGFKGHLGDQDFFTLLGFEHADLFYKLDCGWNRQLCTWWKDHGYREVFDQYQRCDDAVKMYHGNCSTPIPEAAAVPAASRAAASTRRDQPPARAERPAGDERVDLAVTACGDRLDEALTMIKSAVVSTHARLRLHVFADDALRPQLQERLSAWPEEARRKFELKLHPISYPGVDDPETWRKLFKPCASQRLFYPYLIEGTERVLYVDTDVLFLRPIDELWSFFGKFAPEQIAALAPESEDAPNSWYPRFAKHPYFRPAGVNSGVMLMDLAKMRQVQWRERLLAYRQKYTSIPWGDQDLINIFFAESPEKLYVYSCEWNYRPDHCQYMSNCQAAEERGIAVVHGNRQAFHGDKQPTFKALYDAFDAAGPGQSAAELLGSVKAGLAAVADKSRCGQVNRLFTEPLEERADGGEDLDFYHDVAVAQLAPWRATGIRREDLDAAVKATPWPLTRYQILGGSVFRSAECMFPARCKGIEHFLAEIAPKLGKDVEFLVNVQDVPVSSVKHPLPIFSFSKIPAEHADILYPAWAFWEGGPALEVIPEWRWDLNRRDLLDAGTALSWEARKPVLFFRGSRTSPTRDPYVLRAQQAGSAWDVHFTLNQSQRDTEHVTQVLKLTPAQPVSPRDHCAYRYLLNFDGVAASFRLKNLLACGGLVFYVEPKWVEFFYSKLVPWEHYVPLGLDVDEAVRVVDSLKADDARAQRIARSGREFIEKHLTLAHVRRYWLDLLREYASVQKFTPRRDDGLALVAPAAAPTDGRSEAK